MAVVNFQGVECCSDHLEDIRTVKRCRSRAVTVKAVMHSEGSVVYENMHH